MIKPHNKSVNPDAFFARCARYKCAGYGWRLEMTSIRENGMDEYWLQDYIWNNLSCLGLGNLEPIAKEKRQTSGGRLDILMKGSDEARLG